MATPVTPPAKKAVTASSAKPQAAKRVVTKPTGKRRPPPPPPKPRHGLIRITATITGMMVAGAALGVLAAHFLH